MSNSGDDSDAESQMTITLLRVPTLLDREEAIRRNPVFWTPEERSEYRAARQTGRKAQKRKHEGSEKRPVSRGKRRKAEKGERAENQSGETPEEARSQRGLLRDGDGKILGSLRLKPNMASTLSTRSAVKARKRRQRTL